MGPLLEVHNLHTWFETDSGAVHAVDDVSFTLEHGETLGVVGESGSGKTVLVRSIMGLLLDPRVRVEGRVLFDGRDLLKLAESEIRRLLGAEIAMVFQDPMTALNPVMRIGKQLIEGLRLHRGLSRDQALGVAAELLLSVGISEPDHRLRQFPHQLSGGMRQRVMVAIAMACGPRLILADEPTTALDVTVQADILDLLEDQQREHEMAMVLVSHDLGVIATRTERAAVMYGGKIVEIGPTQDLFTDPRMPYTDGLLRSIPRLDEESPESLQVIEGNPPSLVDLPPGCRFADRCRYAQERCREQQPPLTMVAGSAATHRYACWYPLDGHQKRNAAAARATDAPESSMRMGRV